MLYLVATAAATSILAYRSSITMRVHSCFAVLVAAAIAASPVAAQCAAATNMSGEWFINLDPDFGGHPDTISCTFKQEGLKLTGDCKNDASPSAAAFSGRGTRLSSDLSIPTDH